MTNIWAFLNQTLTVTLAAGLLWFLKMLFKDKLSPRWQYGIWSILLIRMLLPVNIGKGMFVAIPVFVEHIKGLVEKNMISHYSEVYEPAAVKHIIPLLGGKPESFTDWLFVVYILGVIVSLIWYFTAYFRLRLLLKKGNVVSGEMLGKLKKVSKTYGLKMCKTVEIPGITSAFVCGGLRPVLVLPAGQEVDEKVLLHELLHLKYHDEIQSIGWCILRALHWCNPFLQLVFCEIGNDMESLCDQRVLERLEGEERRMYGGILLAMANDKYARVPGTTSISNGGKNIAKRIDSIVRFKKYPKGMALVSICIAVILLNPILFGTDYVFAQDRYSPNSLSEWNYSMAVARVNRCTTPAGALDTYANAILEQNEVKLATALSLKKHKELDTFQDEEASVWNTYWLSDELRVRTWLYGATYNIWNVEKLSDKLYKANIVFNIYNVEGAVSSLIIPVEVRYEDAWIVEETAERIVCLEPMMWTIWPGKGMNALRQYAAAGETGEITIKLWTINGIDNGVTQENNLLGITPAAVCLDAEFSSVDVKTVAEYSYENVEGEEPADFYGVIYKGMEKEGVIPEFEKTYVGAEDGGGYGGDISESWAGQQAAFGKTLSMTGGATYFDGTDTYLKSNANPVSYAVHIFWDGKQVEELIAKPVIVDDENIIYGKVYGQGQRAIHMDAVWMSAFANEKNNISRKEEYQLPIEEVYDKIEELTFADETAALEILQELELAGIYPMENNTSSEIPSYYPQGVSIYAPVRYYNANDGTWMIAFGGYCYEEADTAFLSNEVGLRERFGIVIEAEKSIYECGSLILDHRASLANADGSIRKETLNSSSDDAYGGEGFELQDYVDDGEYVGYRWFGLMTYEKGFEKMNGDLIVFYNHTK